MDTQGYGGERLKKKIQVISNDPQQPNLILSVSGVVEKFALISAKRVVIRTQQGVPLSRKVIITPRSKYPFKIKGVKLLEKTHLSQSLKKIEGPNGTAYELTVVNKSQAVGQFSEPVTLITDSRLRPEIAIWVYGVIFKKKKG